MTGPMLARTFAGRYCTLMFLEANRSSKAKLTLYNGIAASRNVLLCSKTILLHPCLVAGGKCLNFGFYETRDTNSGS